MHVEGNTHEKGFRKSAKTVGNVIGNYHPHGDSSVYEAMVRMSQDWKVRNVLIEMHGNNGSMDGDPPAAMRYTEARFPRLPQNYSVILINKQSILFLTLMIHLVNQLFYQQCFLIYCQWIDRNFSWLCD